MSGAREFAGAIVTQAVKVFDLVMARTVLPDGEVAQAGFAPSSARQPPGITRCTNWARVWYAFP